MKRMIVAAVAALAILGVALPAGAGGRPLSADLNGANEVPGPGDSDGTGATHVTLNQGQGEVCFDISVSNIGTPLAAHIHTGTADVAGGVVVNLDIANNGLSGCVEGVDPALIKDIRQNPSGFYVNVHTAAFPPGAVRGQLEK